MQQPFQHIKKVILLLIAMQILNNGLFAQDVLYNSGEAAIIHSVTDYIAKNIFHKTPNTPKHKHQKHRQHTLKHSDVKFVSYNSFSILSIDNYFKQNNFYYSFYLPTFTSDIVPEPPKASSIT
jgi:hypothetical protein